MVQVRGVARLLRATAERELAQRPETLNYGLLVLHLQPPPVLKLACTPSGVTTAFWAVDRIIASPVPAAAVDWP